VRVAIIYINHLYYFKTSMQLPIDNVFVYNIYLVLSKCAYFVIGVNDCFDLYLIWHHDT